jgi:glyoxylase-like metal-dependent hydrolase (beta-lactamase superfamily II)
MLHIETLVFSPFQENTYLVYTDTGACAIVDPGMLFPEEEQKLVSRIEELGLKPEILLQTHLHLDHVFGTAFVTRQWGLKPVAHKGDHFLIEHTRDMATQFGIPLKENPPEPERWLEEGERLSLGDEELEVFHVPGHSPGGIVFYNEANKMLLAGDVLFKGSIGRADLPGGDQDALVEGIRRKLLVLPDEVNVYSGHGPLTTIGEEKQNNPFLT